MNDQQWLWLVPIIVGLSLLFAVFYYRRQAILTQKAIQSLYDVNQQSNQDALTFIESAWPVLESVNVSKLYVEGRWFGEPFKRLFYNEQPQTQRISETLQQQDIEMTLIFSTPRLAKEQRLLLSLVKQTFVNILHSDITLKQMQVLMAQSQLQRYQLHLQHDLKNLNQSIQLMQRQIENSDAHSLEQCQKLMQHLKSVFPLLGKQANEVLRPLTVNRSGEEELEQAVNLNSLIKGLAEAYRLTYKMEADSDVLLHQPQEVVNEVFKNLLSNYRDHPQQEDLLLKIKIMKDEEVVRVLLVSQQSKGLSEKKERLFEPFWTTSKSGLGLGLFLVRESLKLLNGEIKVVEGEQEQGFEVVIPLKKS